MSDETDITGDQIEAFFRKKLKMLAHADDYAISAALDARCEAIVRDKAEWEALDDDCKAYLLEYLAIKDV